MESDEARTHRPGPVVQVLPKSGLNDQELTIRASGLHPHQVVTLRVHVYTESGKHRFESHAEYRADALGHVEVRRDPSIGGCYTGVEPMGLIWSLSPAADIANKWPRLVKRDISKPFVFTFELVDEFDNVLDTAVAERRYRADYIDRHLVSYGAADGCLYIPKQKGNSDPLPVILDIRGGVTFLIEDRPSLLASHGFATISVNYFMKMINGRIVMDGNRFFDLQIFLDIYDFIVKHPRLDEHRIGIASSCMGGVLAMQALARLGDRLPVRCISATGCLDFLGYEVGLKLPDSTLIEPYFTSAHYEVIEEPDGSHIWQLPDFNAFDNVPEEFKIPVEDIMCPILFLINGDDQHIPSHKRMMAMKERIENAGNGHLLEVVHLEGAGHFIDAPYLPLCRRSNIDPKLPYPVFGDYGGDKRLHAYALKTAWRKNINWFRGQLGVTEVYRDDWLDAPETRKAHVSTSRL